MVAQVESGTLDIGAPIMGLAGEDGEVLAGDPIPAAPGQGNNANIFDGDGNSAIVGDSNLWDPLIIEPETIFVQGDPLPSESNGPTGPTSEVE